MKIKCFTGWQRRVVWSIFIFVQFIAVFGIFASFRDAGNPRVVVLMEDFAILPKTQTKTKPKNTSITANANANTNGNTNGIDFANNTKTSTVTDTITDMNRGGGLPSLEELTSIIPANYGCPVGTKIFENIVLPWNVTHVGRTIPKVIHITAKTRCVTKSLRNHILRWKFPDHSLYLHDDNSAYKLLDYTLQDKHGHELVEGLSKSALCISSGATMSDLWRYAMLYHYGGIYTDLDNAPGKRYKTAYITPETDSFFFVEPVGTMSQYYMAASRHHPILLHFLNVATRALYSARNNVMRNNPAKTTGPGAVKKGMIRFLNATNIHSDGYETEGIYQGGLGSNLESKLPWLFLENDRNNIHNGNSDNDNNSSYIPREYPKLSELVNRTVTIFGTREDKRKYILRSGLDFSAKKEAFEIMNMTHYQSMKPTKYNKISCQQHVLRMETETTNRTSPYYLKSKITDLQPNYEFRERHYFDTRTNETLIPWREKNIVLDK